MGACIGACIGANIGAYIGAFVRFVLLSDGIIPGVVQDFSRVQKENFQDTVL
jgi:hypothetical protein